MVVSHKNAVSPEVKPNGQRRDFSQGKFRKSGDPSPGGVRRKRTSQRKHSKKNATRVIKEGLTKKNKGKARTGNRSGRGVGRVQGKK